MTVMVVLLALGIFGVAGMAAWLTYVNNVERPRYRSVRADGAVELRDYPPLIVAEVRRSGDRRGAVNAGFRPLANYIFEKDRNGDRISMTAPVTQTHSEPIAMTAPVTQEQAAWVASNAGADNVWTIRFIMPSKYKLAELPQPAGNDVRLLELPARRIAAIRFSGVATDILISAQEAKLRTRLKKQGIATEGAAIYAYYNDPFTPGFLRRNEVMLRVKDGQDVTR